MNIARLLGRVPRQIWTFTTLKSVSWLDDSRIGACRYPRNEKVLRELAAQGVTMLINLDRRAHDPSVLARQGMCQIHIPVRDFTAPTPEQLDRGISAIDQAIADGRRVVVHCGAGLGRTGTLLACYMVKQGLTVDEAITRIRTIRPGSVETPGQERAVHSFALRIQLPRQDSSEVTNTTTSLD